MKPREWPLYPEWALRRVARHYRRPPWELADVPEDEIIAEAEYIDLNEEIAELDG